MDIKLIILKINKGKSRQDNNFVTELQQWLVRK